MKSFRLYLILDKSACGSKDLKAVLKKAIKGGVDIVQYRDKVSTAKTMIREAMPLLKVARQSRIPFIINDRLDVALAIGADGLHLGQEDAPVKVCRKILGKDKIIGLSCHSLMDIKKAQKEDVDYLGFGPVFKTATKPQSPARGEGAFKKAQALSRKPVFAIGGIKKNRLSKISGSKPLLVAVCRELCLAKDIFKKAKELKRKITDVS